MTLLVYCLVCVGCVVLVMSQTKYLERRPHGPKMCKSLCSSIIGCSSNEFLMPYLTCHLTMTSQRGHFTKGLSAFQNKTKRENRLRNKGFCPFLSKVVHSRTRGVTCISFKERPSYPPELTPVPTEKETKKIIKSHHHLKTKFAKSKIEPTILLAPHMIRSKHNILRVHPHNSNSDKYPYTEVESVTSMTYVWRYKKLLISAFKPSKITSIVLNKPRLTTLKFGITARGISVDEDEELVFIITSRSKIINSMSLEGGRFTKIVLQHSLNDIKSIEVDPVRKMLYLAGYHTLLSSSYDGTGVQELYNTPNRMLGFTFKLIENALYFTEGHDVMKLLLVNKTVSRIKTLKYEPFDLECYGDDIFVTFFRRLAPDVGVIHKSAYRNLKTEDAGGKFVLAVVV